MCVGTSYGESMETMRQSWTDDRLDDMSDRIDQRFDQVDQRFDRLETDVTALRTEMNTRFDSLNRTLLQVGGGVIVALIGLIATQL